MENFSMGMVCQKKKRRIKSDRTTLMNFKLELFLQVQIIIIPHRWITDYI